MIAIAVLASLREILAWEVAMDLRHFAAVDEVEMPMRSLDRASSAAHPLIRLREISSTCPCSILLPNGILGVRPET